MKIYTCTCSFADFLFLFSITIYKYYIFVAFSDELRHFLGSDTARIGVTRVFDMFQYRSLNRRLVYVVLEGVIETLFPQNKFKELFRKLHSQSDRLRVANSKNEPENQSAKT